MGHLHKLRTQAEFEKLQELWKHISTVRYAFHGLPSGGFAFVPSDEALKKQSYLDAGQSFSDAARTAQLFLNEQALAIPKHIADAANRALLIAHHEMVGVVMYPNPYDPDQLPGDIRRQFLDDRVKHLKEFNTEGDKLELMMRDYMKGKEAEPPKTEQ